MNSSCISSAVLIVVFALAGVPSGVAQEAESGAGSGAAARLLRLVGDPSPALARSLSRDSLRAPGGLWNAAALLQAELTDVGRQRFISAGFRLCGRWRGERRHEARFAHERSQRYVSGRQRHGRALRNRQQMIRSRNDREGGLRRGAAREAWHVLRDSALTVRERRRAIAGAVRDKASAERQAALKRNSAERHARDAALGVDSEDRAALDVELNALRARFEALQQQADSARRAFRSYRAESAGTEGYSPEQKQVIQLHAALGHLLRACAPRDLPRRR